MPSFFLTGFFRRRRAVEQLEAPDDEPGYPVQKSWVLYEPDPWILRMDFEGRPYWLNKVTGQWIYQIKKPSGPTRLSYPSYPLHPTPRVGLQRSSHAKSYFPSNSPSKGFFGNNTLAKSSYFPNNNTAGKSYYGSNNQSLSTKGSYYSNNSPSRGYYSNNNSLSKNYFPSNK